MSAAARAATDSHCRPLRVPPPAWGAPLPPRPVTYELNTANAATANITVLSQSNHVRGRPPSSTCCLAPNRTTHARPDSHTVTWQRRKRITEASGFQKLGSSRGTASLGTSAAGGGTPPAGGFPLPDHSTAPTSAAPGSDVKN